MQFLKDEKYYSFAKTELINLLPSVRGRFLEIGCGEGATLEYVKTLGASYVVGVDISADAIETASRRGLNVAIAADIEKDELPFGCSEAHNHHPSRRRLSSSASPRGSQDARAHRP